MPDDDLPFKVVRTNSHDELIARAANLLVGPAAYENRKVALSEGRDSLSARARVIERSDEGG